MQRVSMFGLWEIRKSIPVATHKLGGRILKLTSESNAPIVQSQHNYFFIPTTQEQILV